METALFILLHVVWPTITCEVMVESKAANVALRRKMDMELLPEVQSSPRKTRRSSLFVLLRYMAMLCPSLSVD